ncbi:putative hemolysin secretion ATP-binding domain protein, partial [Vibrio parahaemolyticus V-223/04]
MTVMVSIAVTSSCAFAESATTATVGAIAQTIALRIATVSKLFFVMNTFPTIIFNKKLNCNYYHLSFCFGILLTFVSKDSKTSA